MDVRFKIIKSSKNGSIVYVKRYPVTKFYLVINLVTPVRDPPIIPYNHKHNQCLKVKHDVNEIS